MLLSIVGESPAQAERANYNCVEFPYNLDGAFLYLLYLPLDRLHFLFLNYELQAEGAGCEELEN